LKNFLGDAQHKRGYPIASLSARHPHIIPAFSGDDADETQILNVGWKFSSSRGFYLQARS
jgi:hypothetical protein